MQNVVLKNPKNRLKELRQEKRLTIRDLADKVNIEYSALSRFETSQTSLPMNKVISLITYFDVTLDYFFYRIEERKGQYKPQVVEKIVTVEKPLTFRSKDEERLWHAIKQLNSNESIKNLLTFAKSLSYIEEDNDLELPKRNTYIGRNEIRK